ncbi:AAA domain-containing protein, putative AbiEii toxin, Type IV TA system [Clostridium sp. DSM 8431]|uniref:AAA family ATPase n=1 Tax=Clostridium sp. DSM 8431 TaxID=1761781 RepID=UPI0008E9D20C|nr:AAA family ATPase [Clostridium sp. DSM 8431]SFU82346.1 AAA domain-containing protein, putative AbiEii toxin, Type IV TA system [Clostridium sp. DSM 8431]
MKNIVRLQEIQIENFKNVTNGTINFDSFKKKKFFSNSYDADILGIYGQNGSGKTSMVEAIDILKTILSGEKIDKSIKNLLSYNTNSAFFKFIFSIQVEEKKYIVNYKFNLRCNNDEDRVEIFKELLEYSSIDFDTKKVSAARGIVNFDMDKDSEEIFLPMKNYNIVVREGEKTNLIVSKEFAKENSTSFIFNKRSMQVWEKSFKGEEEFYYEILRSLQNYAITSFVIKNDYLGHVDLSSIMPLNFLIDSKKGIARGMLVIRLFDTNTVSKEILEILNKIIEQINIVLNSLIPGLTIEIKIIKEELMEDGEVGHILELLSVRESGKIPLKYESDGIKKIISILSALIAMYNNEKICVVIDELDSGIFEFLLGELLGVLKEKAKGQLIFTSHNLRALEVLDKYDIIFTTANPQNRYIRLKYVKDSNNLRDFYLRQIFLGGQNEIIYKRTKSYAISRAFRKAGVKNESR